MSGSNSKESLFKTKKTGRENTVSLSYQTLANKEQFIPQQKVFKPETKDKPSVLLIEDDRTLRRMVRAEIGEHCDLLVAGNMQLGSKLYKTESPDLAFIDINLPDGNGHDLLDWMLKVDPHTFAVMFSGHSDNDSVYKSVEMGARGFVSKPFDAHKMLFFIGQCQNKAC
ncbi:MAG: response regulator [Bdellovibrionales bacterium]